MYINFYLYHKNKLFFVTNSNIVYVGVKNTYGRVTMTSQENRPTCDVVYCILRRYNRCLRLKCKDDKDKTRNVVKKDKKKFNIEKTRRI